MLRTPLTTAALGAAVAATALAPSVAEVGAAVAAPRNGAAASAISGLGNRLQVALAGSGDANLVLSPASITIGLAMTSAGAAGDTLAEFGTLLGSTDPALHSELGALSADLTSAADGSFTLANSLWVQDGFAIAEPFVATLTDDYGAPPRPVDFEADPAAATAEVNEWVATETDGRITELLAPDALDELTRLVLANAVHLDADWVSPFDPALTAPDEFTRDDGSTVAVDFMHQSLNARYGELDGTQLIVLPYTNGFELIVALPPEGGLADFEADLAAAGSLDAVFPVMTETEVELALPRWDFGDSLDLVDPLIGLGLVLAFDDSGAADFTNISTEIPLWLSAVVHEADITVDEEGTEAAAATAVVVGEVMAMPPDSTPEPVVMDVDRPFFFAIRDFASTAVVFQGHVGDPSAG